MFGQKEGSPVDLIQEAFGDKQYTISFSSEGLDEPIPDLTYSAEEIPALPTPKRVGYAFVGWYMDEGRTKPYDKDLLYLLMKNITLYASWVAEEFAINGIYDIAYEAHIMPETVVEGPKTEYYGGYYDFSESLIADGIYLEKTDTQMLLRIQYDCHTTVPFGAEQSLYSVAVNPRTGTDVYIAETIASDVETVKTIFIKVTDFDLSQPIYLDVSFMNWMASGLTLQDRSETLTTYIVQFNVTDFIGFSRSYENPELPLEDGWYQVKTHYKQESNKDTMIESFNPVYAYIYAQNGQYKLIKPFTPYAGLMGVSGEAASLNDYYHRLMTFAQAMTFYRFNENLLPEGKTESDYFPATYGGEYYGNLSVEFHADTGELYYIFDLGTDYRSPMMVYMAVTGFMEIASAMGSMNMIMTIDYDHILKVPNYEYDFLEGDAYRYTREELYYPGSVGDLSDQNLAKELVEEYGISSNFFNLYFSTSDYREDFFLNRSMYSFSYTVTPKSGSNASTVAESRFRPVVLDVDTKIYGYIPDSNQFLYGDSMTATTVVGLGMRETIPVGQGKGYAPGDTVNLAEIYADFAQSDNLNLSGVTWKAFALRDGKTDFNAPISDKIATQFTFSKEMGILFAQQEKDGTTCLTLVELVNEQLPSLDFVNTEENTHNLKLIEQTANYAVFESQNTFVNGQAILYPVLNYQWMGYSDAMIDIFFPSGEGVEDQFGVNPVHAIMYSVKDGVWSAVSVGKESLSFGLTTEEQYLLYELSNPYGKHYCVYVKFPAIRQEESRFEVTADGELFAEGSVRYDEEGEASVAARYSRYYFLTDDNMSEQLLHRCYMLSFLGNSYEMLLSSYTVYSRDSVASYSVSDADRAEAIRKVEEIVLTSNEYCQIRIDYTYGDYYVREYYIVNVNIAGNTTDQIFKLNDYFSETEYIVPKPLLYSGGVRLSTGSITLSAYLGDRYVSNNKQEWFSIAEEGMQYRIVFKKPITYVATIRFWIETDEFGNVIHQDGSGFMISFSQKIQVADGRGNVYITYITDAEHPFKGGLTEVTREYSLTEVIHALKADAFDYRGSDVCYMWSPRQGKTSGYLPGAAIGSFVTTFHSRNIKLYAYWDKGITVKLNFNTQLTGIEDKEIVLYRRTVSPYQGSFMLNLASFVIPDNKIPAGYVFEGWTGDIMNNEIYAPDKTVYFNESWIENGGTYEVRAVFTRLMKVSYDLSAKHPESGETFCPSQYFFPIEYILQGTTVPNAEFKLNLGCNVAGYQFKGWYIYGDESKTIVDLKTYQVESDTVFVALYDAIDDEE